MNVLFTFGVSDDGKSMIKPDAQGNMQFFAQGCCNILGKLPLGAIQPIPYLLYGPNAKQPPLRLPAPPQLVFNQLAEADSHRVALERCVELCDALAVPVLNDPSRVLDNTRDQMAKTLLGIDGLKVPRVIRCAPSSPESVLEIAQKENLPFPWLLRTCGEHSGKHMVLVEDSSELGGLNIFPFDGRDFYLMEYVNYADEKGHFLKHRLAVVGDAMHFRHSLFDRHWIVHVRTSTAYMMKTRPDLDKLQHLRALQDDLLPRIRPVVKEIQRRLGLDFFGIDFSMLPDGRMVLFEANANMNLLTESLPELMPVTHEIADSFMKLIHERLRQPGQA